MPYRRDGIPVRGAPYREWVNRLDIKSDDVLLVSSDIQRAALTVMRNGEIFSPSLLIESFQKKLGPEGTLLFPTFNWGFCRGVAFDYKNTPCMTGTLGREALKRSDFRRSLHPIYSFAVWGRDRDRICGTDNVSSFGADSPFAYLHKFGKNLIIDVSMRHCMTFTHYVEEQTGVPYRFMKTFTAPYRGPDGREEIRSYDMFVRRLEMNVETLIDPLGEDLKAEGLCRTCFIDGVAFSTLLFSDFFMAARRDILENRAGKLCRYDGQGLVK
ncbi:MAG: AAC(3) family N-acetyltransferase [Synergistaceae bacterium]|jgi:aminoglycoside 3-N-acetyltransferase|nr:AAC(3) family N-acetyltransferase [Synergistaceae bacterium]